MTHNLIKAVWAILAKQNKGTITNYLPAWGGLTTHDKYVINFIEKRQLPEWNYQNSFFERQLHEINEKQETFFRFVKSVLISGTTIEDYYRENEQKVTELVQMVKKRKFEYDEDDTSTWIDNFIYIEYQGEKVYFSHETSEGEFLWSLYGSLEPLNREIEIGGALCVVYIDN